MSEALTFSANKHSLHDNFLLTNKNANGKPIPFFSTFHETLPPYLNRCSSISEMIDVEEKKISVFLLSLRKSNIPSLNLDEEVKGCRGIVSSREKHNYHKKNSLKETKTGKPIQINEGETVKVTLPKGTSQSYKLLTFGKISPLKIDVLSTTGRFMIYTTLPSENSSFKDSVACFNSMQNRLYSYAKTFSSQYVYIKAHSIDQMSMEFECNFSTEYDLLWPTSERKKLKPVDQLKSTMKLLRTSSTFRDQYNDAIKRILAKKVGKQDMSVHNHIIHNKCTAVKFNDLRAQQISKTKEERSKTNDIKAKKQNEVMLTTARKIVVNNRLEIKSASINMYDQVKRDYSTMKRRIKALYIAVFLVRSFKKLHIIYQEKHEEYKARLSKTVSTYKIISLLRTNLKKVSLQENSRLLRPFIAYIELACTSSKKASKNREIKTVKIFMEHILRVTNVNNRVSLVFKYMTKIKKRLRMFTTLHKQRIELLKLYWKLLLDEYKQILKRFKNQPYLSTLEDNIKFLESVTQRQKTNTVKRIISIYYQKTNGKAKGKGYSRSYMWYIKEELKILWNNLYLIYGKKKPESVVSVIPSPCLLLPAISFENFIKHNCSW